MRDAIKKLTRIKNRKKEIERKIEKLVTDMK